MTAALLMLLIGAWLLAAFLAVLVDYRRGRARSQHPGLHIHDPMETAAAECGLIDLRPYIERARERGAA